jgi:hypothetical protein
VLKSTIIMKKAKIFLSAFAVLALVAGALAFNANKYTGTVFCTSAEFKTAGTTGCPAIPNSTYKTTGSGSFCTITNGNPCDVVAKPAETN